MLQPLIGYLAAPSFANAQNGQQILICTLKGLQVITLDSEVIPAAVVDTGDCPALTLSQIMASGLPPKPTTVPVLPQPPKPERTLVEAPPPQQWHYPGYISRAPPLAYPLSLA